MRFRKYLYMLLDKHVLKKHQYYIIKGETLEFCENLWDVFRKHGYSVYQIIDVSWDGRFWYIVRKRKYDKERNT